MVVFIVIGLAIFAGLQDLFVPAEPLYSTGKIIHGMEALPDDTVDVLFAGSSHAANGISPMTIYEETGICGYNLSTVGQMYDMGYYVLERVLQTQHPSFLVLDAGSLYHDLDVDWNGNWWPLLNEQPLDGIKFEMAKAYNTHSYSEGILPALIPMIKYHSRWNQLTAYDFKWRDDGLYYSAGYELFTSVNPAEMDVDAINTVSEEIKSRNNRPLFYHDTEGEVKTQNASEPMYEEEMKEYYLEYLKKIQALCEEHNITLILIKVPDVFYPAWYSSWTAVKSNAVKELAAQMGIPFYDLLYDYNAVDFSTDTYDGGRHLNYSGALKVSRQIGEILKNVYGCPENRNDAYDRMLADFKKVENVALIEGERDFGTYIERLAQNKDHLTILVAACSEYTAGMTEDDYSLLRDRLGLSLIADGAYADSYVAAIENGKVLYEGLSGREINYDLEVSGTPVHLYSAGWASGRAGEINLGEDQYAALGGGLTFVVLDNESGVVIDYVAFNSFQPGKPPERTAEIEALNKYLRKYIHVMCFDYLDE